MSNEMYHFENNLWKVTIAQDGTISKIVDKAQNQFLMVNQYFTIQTDCGLFNQGQTQPNNYHVKEEDEQVTITLCYHLPYGLIEVYYEFGRLTSFLHRKICVTPSEQDLVLLNIEDRFRTTPLVQEFIPYDTFWNSPTVVFLRWEHLGLFAGYENPFFGSQMDEDALKLSFTPSIVLASGHSYSSDRFFCGLTSRGDYTIIEDIPKTSLSANGRYHTRYRNPSSHMPLDLGEIRAFSRYAEQYLQAQIPQFELVYYMYWTPLKTDDETRYCHLLDSFKQLGGDRVILVPPTTYEAPCWDGKAFWELAQPNSIMESVLAHAKTLDLKIGFYTGSASNHSEHCISSMIDFDPKRSRGWSKRDHQGRAAAETCLADDSFADWYAQCIQNTIDKYDLKVFGWDPGPGNGLFCYATNHGHIPGRGGYKGWRNAMAVTHKLYENNHDIYFQGFHGTKEHGLWGQLHTHQNESYWEQKPGQMAALPPDYSADRITAYGMSQQAYWNQMFRFLPPYTTHALAHRMYQSCHSPTLLAEDFDWRGCYYAFLSALSTGACVTLPIIPNDLSTPQGREYRGFVRKWTRWAKDTWHYACKSVPIPDFSPSPGAVHGTARIVEREGYIFLFNPNPRETYARIPLNWTIGAMEPGRYMLEYMYPWEGGCVRSSQKEPWLFEYNDTIDVPVPGWEAIVLHLMPDDHKIHHAGRGGVLKLQEGQIILEDVVGFPGERRCYASTANVISVNGHSTTANMGEWVFEGEILPRQLDEWSESGEVQLPVFLIAEGKHEISKSLFIPSRIKQLLRLAQNDYSEDHAEKIAQLRRWIPQDCYIWAQPYRLFLTIPFDDANKVSDVIVKINDNYVQAEHFSAQTYGNNTIIGWYLDITDYVSYNDVNTFSVTFSASSNVYWMGPTLEYPMDKQTRQIKPELEQLSIVQKGVPLGRQMPRGCAKDNEKKPLILNAWTSGSFASEEDVTIFAAVNLPVEDLEGVYMAAQVNITARGRSSCFSDIPMTYDTVTGLYTHTIHNGDRKLTILDAPELHLWCVDKNGNVSEGFSLAIQWRL